MSFLATERGTAEETVEFLSPVSKASEWESNNHSEDVLNFTNSDHDRQFPRHPPKDRFVSCPSMHREELQSFFDSVASKI